MVSNNYVTNPKKLWGTTFIRSTLDTRYIGGRCRRDIRVQRPEKPPSIEIRLIMLQIPKNSLRSSSRCNTSLFRLSISSAISCSLAKFARTNRWCAALHLGQSRRSTPCLPQLLQNSRTFGRRHRGISWPCCR